MVLAKSIGRGFRALRKNRSSSGITRSLMARGCLLRGGAKSHGGESLVTIDKLGSISQCDLLRNNRLEVSRAR